jgi:hypothetical protein
MRSVFFGFMTAPGLTTAGGATWRLAATATRSPRFESGDSAEDAQEGSVDRLVQSRLPHTSKPRRLIEERNRA